MLETIGMVSANARLTSLEEFTVRLRRSARPGELVSEATVGFTVLPNVHRVMNSIGRLLNQQGMRINCKLTRKIQQFVRLVKDASDPLVRRRVQCDLLMW